MDLIDDSPGPDGPSNAHDYTVSEISGAVKRVIEGEFGRVRVRGEVGRVSRPSSGHMYFDLKDANAVISAVSWKGQVARMQIRPEEGMEVIATGKLTTFPGQSRYQLIVETVEPAGAGALMAMLEARRKQLAAEGLFDPARKRPLPYLPEVIGVVTSPSGAVIRDILHRLRDRFPRRVLIWPVAVQGQACASEVSAAIRGFNALTPGGPIPRPDLLIVARGGGSLEDLWGFNEEAVVRAAAESQIPLISAVGHETDTTLIDYASDRRAPTPTAAAEIAVPVRAELLARLNEMEARSKRALLHRLDVRRQRLSDLSRGLGRPQALIAPKRQRFDLTADRLLPALDRLVVKKRAAFATLAAQVSPRLLQSYLRHEGQKLAGLSERFAQAQKARLVQAHERLERLERLRQTLGYTETLRRGYAVVRGPGDTVLTTARAAGQAGAFEVEFADGRLSVSTGAAPVVPVSAPVKPPKPAPKPRAKKKDTPPEQGSLF
ncbi:exodeoxyribonuclease VII large subunit [Rhodobacter aestuarii]|uniref:Exodeoxyribonuclease 7 large subunit n=1 Tax=Rhodobacter aestuarii TaxID=453582 RepID=A0A1N7NRQ5_9RHOB|nr:exodeoxyribonuclease VII large subunit [Rhodobacter aestuarii]PTV94591.1 exodeoxyribonuclease VII large subunit [Rhodobacter aestuarii]SIT00986.1 Exodeoxyribonuclease VII large subunit [Rhodobacter aestuarii]